MVPTDVELAAAAAGGGAPAPAVVPVAVAPVAAAPVAPAAPPAPAAAAPVAPAPVAPAPAAAPTPPPGDPAWLPQRLDQAKRTGQTELLSKYGVKTAEELDQKLARLRELETASLTDAQRQQQELETLRAQANTIAPALSVIKTRVERELSVLTAEQRAAVVALAGDDPTQQLRTIDALSPTWGLTPAGSAPAAAPAAAPIAVPAAAPAPAAPAPLPAPGNTVAPGAAPAPVVPGSPPDHKAHYESIKKTNPVAAAHYLKRHQDQIYPPTA